MTDILERPETLARDADRQRGPLFAQTVRGVEAANSAFEDGRAAADADERAAAWRAVLRGNLL